MASLDAWQLPLFTVSRLQGDASAVGASLERFFNDPIEFTHGYGQAVVIGVLEQLSSNQRRREAFVAEFTAHLRQIDQSVFYNYFHTFLLLILGVPLFVRP
jgi:hypothetical protein